MPTDGEQWAGRELEALLERRFRPTAIGRFLAASQRRSNHVRSVRRDVARREVTWAAVGVAGWLALAVARVEPFRRRTRSGIGGWAITVLMLDWHLGMLETPDGRPRNLGPADAATLVRAWLVPAVADEPRVVLCGLGLLTDVLDGYLARATEPTRLGRDLEGLVDAAFALAVLRGARRRRRLSTVTAIAEGARLGVGVGYAIASYFARAQAPDARLLRAARAIAPMRAAGLILAVGGRRRLGEPLVLAGSLASVVVVVLAHAAPQQESRSRWSSTPA